MQALQPVIFGSRMARSALFPQLPVLNLSETPAGRRNRRLLAAIGAIGLHVILVCAFLGSRPGGVLAADGGATQADVVEPYIVLSLAGRRHNAADLASGEPAQEAAMVAAMMARMRQAAPEVIVAPQPSTRQASLGALFEAVERERAARAGAASGRSERDDGGRGADTNAPDVKPRDKAGPRAPVQNAAKASAGAGSLWGFLEPCWRRLPGRSSVPVTLEVALDSRGLISTPPKILRPSNAPPTEDRLVAEARALAALSECLPYHGPDSVGGAPIAVEFAASR